MLSKFKKIEFRNYINQFLKLFNYNEINNFFLNINIIINNNNNNNNNKFKYKKKIRNIQRPES